MEDTHLDDLEDLNDEQALTIVAGAPTSDTRIVVEAPMDAEEQMKNKKKMVWGRAFYGDTFTRFTLSAENEPYLPQFRDFYIAEMTANPSRGAFDIIKEFNERITPAKFHPYSSAYQAWRKRWDTTLLNNKGIMVTAHKIKQVMKTKSEKGLHAPDESEMEMGMRHLGGELMNDALDMLHRDQDTPELFEPDELIKRRGYALNVFAHVTRMVHGKESLKLKKSAEARETAGFLMDIMQQATAGKLAPETLEMMHSTVSPTLPNVAA